MLSSCMLSRVTSCIRYRVYPTVANLLFAAIFKIYLIASWMKSVGWVDGFLFRYQIRCLTTFHLEVMILDTDWIFSHDLMRFFTFRIPTIFVFLTNEWVRDVVDSAPARTIAVLNDVTTYMDLVPTQLTYVTDQYSTVDARIRPLVTSKSFTGFLTSYSNFIALNVGLCCTCFPLWIYWTVKNQCHGQTC